MIIIGIMSGTSMDGVDAALVDFTKNGFELLDFVEVPFAKDYKKKVLQMTRGELKMQDVSQLNFYISNVYADAVNELIERNSINNIEIAAIGMHGQTVWHEPKASVFLGRRIASTLQLGNASALREMTGIRVISDFRSADIAAGGVGAPLVPIFDYNFYRSEAESIAMLNIGGIANVTLLPAGCSKSQVLAFDTGPGNCLIDEAMMKYFALEYDENGKTAAMGKIDDALLYDLMQDDYFSKPIPKSTGRELFYLERYNFDGVDRYDIIATLTMYTAKSIAIGINKFGGATDKVIVSGGGAFNEELMKYLAIELPKSKIEKAKHIAEKEAICFAYLAYLNLTKQPGNLPSVTGASRELLLGVG